MSHYWQVDLGLAFAASQLANHENLSPSFRMMLARRFDIDHWIPGLTLELLKLPYQDVTGMEIIECSTDVWAVINKARDSYRESLNILAVTPPSLPREGPHSFMPYCPNHTACIREWELVWYSKVGRRLLIEDENQIHPSGIMEYVCSLPFPKMGRECRRDALELLQANPDAFSIKEKVEAAAILGVRRVLGLPNVPVV